jgi:hypothetical protein
MTDAERVTPMNDPSDQNPRKRRCSQCGREGTGGFLWLTHSTPFLVICANKDACRRRYEKQRPPHDPDAEL